MWVSCNQPLSYESHTKCQLTWQPAISTSFIDHNIVKSVSMFQSTWQNLKIKKRKKQHWRDCDSTPNCPYNSVLTVQLKSDNDFNVDMICLLCQSNIRKPATQFIRIFNIFVVTSRFPQQSLRPSLECWISVAIRQLRSSAV